MKELTKKQQYFEDACFWNEASIDPAAVGSGLVGAAIQVEVNSLIVEDFWDMHETDRYLARAQYCLERADIPAGDR